METFQQLTADWDERNWADWEWLKKVWRKHKGNKWPANAQITFDATKRTHMTIFNAVNPPCAMIPYDVSGRPGVYSVPTNEWQEAVFRLMDLEEYGPVEDTSAKWLELLGECND